MAHRSATQHTLWDTTGTGEARQWAEEDALPQAAAPGSASRPWAATDGDNLMMIKITDLTELRIRAARESSEKPLFVTLLSVPSCADSRYIFSRKQMQCHQIQDEGKGGPEMEARNQVRSLQSAACLRGKGSLWLRWLAAVRPKQVWVWVWV